MDNTTNFKKLVVFDFNIDWKDYTDQRKYKDLALVYPLIKQASLYQTVVLSTSASLIDAIDFMKDKDIHNGYLIASGGAIVYDLAKKEIISKNCLNENEVHTTIHHGMMLGLNMIITTTTNKYIFVSNAVTYTIIKDKTYSPYTVIKNYSEYKDLLAKQDIVDISYVNLVSPHKELKDNFNTYKWEKYFESEITDLRMKINQSSIFAHIAKADSTKIKALLKIMSVTGVTQFSDVLYIASSCINKECFINFKNALLCSNPDFEFEINDVKKKRLYLSNEINNLDGQFGLKSDSFWK